MRGTIEVDTVALHAPAAPTAAGGMARFDGLAPAGAGEITLERRPPGGAFAAFARATADAAGRFAFAAAADGPARFRARTSDLLSGGARLDVAPALALTVRRSA